MRSVTADGRGFSRFSPLVSPTVQLFLSPFFPLAFFSRSDRTFRAYARWLSISVRSDRDEPIARIMPHRWGLRGISATTGETRRHDFPIDRRYALESETRPRRSVVGRRFEI